MAATGDTAVTVTDGIPSRFHDLLTRDAELVALQRATTDPELRFRLCTAPADVVGRPTLEVARIKRFLECRDGDAGFRAALAAQKPVPGFSAEEVAALRPLFDPEARAAGTLTRLSAKYLIFRNLAHQQAVARFHAAAPADPRFSAWRTRQIRRCGYVLAEAPEAVAHIPAAFELSRGCTVGCWFCGISAQKFAGHWPYTPDTAALWLEVLDVLAAFCGPAAAQAILYWGTDPLDNPDYGYFADAFRARLGTGPSLTTALPMRAPQRTRDLLHDSLRRGDPPHRFSILSSAILRKVHQTFSPEELLFTPMALQHGASTAVKALAGKARTHPTSGNTAETPDTAQTTIACVSGFLFHMPARTVALITPCPADDTYPDGYRTYAKAHFDDGAGLRAVLEDMIAQHMAPKAPEHTALGFCPGARFNRDPYGFQLAYPGGEATVTHPTAGAVFAALGALLLEGRHTLDDLAARMQAAFGISADTTRHLTAALADQGLLWPADPNPRPHASAEHGA